VWLPSLFPPFTLHDTLMERIVKFWSPPIDRGPIKTFYKPIRLFYVTWDAQLL